MNINGIQKTNFPHRQSQTGSRVSPAKPYKADMQGFDTFISSHVSDQKTIKKTTLEELMLSNASPQVKNAWSKAGELTGYNPYTDKDGKIVGSALFARHIEMEYNLELRYGAQEAKARMSSLFSDTDAARSLINAALDRANNPLVSARDPAAVEREKQFYEAFLSCLE